MDKRVEISRCALTEVRILDGNGKTVCYQNARAGKMNMLPTKIIGTYWLMTKKIMEEEKRRMVGIKESGYATIAKSDNFADYFLVTNTEIEFYKVAASKVAKKPIKSLMNTISHHWYLPSAQFLLTVDSANMFSGFLISAKGITLVSRFELASNPSESSLASRSYYHQVSLHVLYGKISLFFVHELKGELHVYTLTSHAGVWSFRFSHTLSLFSSSRFEVSVLDELIIVHSLHTKLPMLFDIRTGSQPIVAPLPMHIIADNSVTTCTYPKSWYFLSPCFILDYDKTNEAISGTLWCLKLEHHSIARAWGALKREKLLDYLLKRRGTKWLIFSLLRQWLTEYSEGTSSITLMEISNLFLMLNRIKLASQVEAEEQEAELNSFEYAAYSECSPLSLARVLHNSLMSVSSNATNREEALKEQRERDESVLRQFLCMMYLINGENSDVICANEDVNAAVFAENFPIDAEKESSSFIGNDFVEEIKSPSFIFDSKLVLESDEVIDENETISVDSSQIFGLPSDKESPVFSPRAENEPVSFSPRSLAMSLLPLKTDGFTYSSYDLIKSGWCDDPDVSVFQTFLTFFYPYMDHADPNLQVTKPLHYAMDVLPPLHVLTRFLGEAYCHGSIYISHLDMYLFVFHFLMRVHFLFVCAIM